MTTLMSIPGVQAVAKRFQEATLTVELHAPDAETLELLATDPQQIINEAKEFKVDTDDEYRLAKQAADALKNEADLIESKRTDGPDGKGGGTKGLNTLKATWDSLFSPNKKARETAAGIYHAKMRAYEKRRRDEDERARKEQANQAKQQKTNLEKQALEHEERAGQLKTPAKIKEALEKAQELRQAAQLIPEEFGDTQTSVPALGSGGKQERWVGEVDADDQEFAAWLLKNPLWRKKIVSYGQAGLNDLAKQVRDNTQIPGFRAQPASSYRREARRSAKATEKS